MTGTTDTWNGEVKGALPAEQDAPTRRVTDPIRPPSPGDALAAELAGVVERQLAQYLGAIGDQLLEVQRDVMRTRHELRSELGAQIDVLTDRLAGQHQINEAHQRALRAALDDQLAELTSGHAAALDDRLNVTGSHIVGLDQRLDQRVGELGAKLDAQLDTQATTIAELIASNDDKAIADVRTELDKAVGEAMLVRIEMDRSVHDTQERFDRQTLRMAQIEAELADDVDVGVAVQLERLDELERAVAELDPDQFVRRDNGTEAGPTSTPAALPDI